MEKLLELLNEHSKKKYNLDMRELNGERGLGFHYINNGSSYSELLMISKKYEFIKWLVENDKIDYDKAKVHHLWKERYSNYESILMKLSIQDEPIRFLCEIIK